MHRVLSYQTAMQINDDREIGTYITKRTCVSLIFSASFFTLILGKPPQFFHILVFSAHICVFFSFVACLGFLLGKFVSDRQYKIRQLTQPKYVAVIEQIHTLRRSIELSARNISDTTYPNSHSVYNRLLWDEATACSNKTIEQIYSDPFENFVEKLVDNKLKMALQCLTKISNIMDTIGRN